MVVGAARHDLVALGVERRRESRAILEHLVLVRLEQGRVRLRQTHGNGRDGVVVGA